MLRKGCVSANVRFMTKREQEFSCVFDCLCVWSFVLESAKRMICSLRPEQHIPTHPCETLFSRFARPIRLVLFSLHKIHHQIAKYWYRRRASQREGCGICESVFSCPNNYPKPGTSKEPSLELHANLAEPPHHHRESSYQSGFLDSVGSSPLFQESYLSSF